MAGCISRNVFDTVEILGRCFRHSAGFFCDAVFEREREGKRERERERERERAKRVSDLKEKY